MTRVVQDLGLQPFPTLLLLLALPLASCDSGPTEPVLDPDPGTFQAEIRGPDGAERVAGLAAFFSPSSIRSDEGVHIPRAALLTLTASRADAPSISFLLHLGLPRDSDLPLTGTYARDEPYDREDPPPGAPGEMAASAAGGGALNPTYYEVTEVEVRLDVATEDRVEGEFTMTMREAGGAEETFGVVGAFSWLDCPTPKPCG